jgi:Uma2 family endonuclease
MTTAQLLTFEQYLLPPHLVVEAISPGGSNRKRDCERKRRQYAARGIPEYWIIDPTENAIALLQLEGGNYLEVGRFEGNTPIQSPELEQLDIHLSLTAEQVLGAVQ